MNDVVEMRWPLALPGRIPLQHEYHLLAALSRDNPGVHDADGIGIHSIRGAAIEPGMLELTCGSSITIRCNVKWLSALLPLSGKRLELSGHFIRLGVPHLIALRPTPQLDCNFVTIKGFLERVPFSAAVRRQLDSLDIRHSITVEVGGRRVRRIKENMIVGFQVTLDGLTDTESLQIQITGIGGRRHLGAGLFSPLPIQARKRFAIERRKET